MAWNQALRSVEDGQRIAIEGVVVVKKDADGKLEIQKVTDSSTRSGLRWGLVGGVVLGVFFPPSISGSAVALGVAGAAVRKAREIHHRSELAQDPEDVIAPGHCGILALVSDPGAIEIRKALEKADAIVERAVDNVAAQDIKDAAKESEESADETDCRDPRACRSSFPGDAEVDLGEGTRHDPSHCGRAVQCSHRR